MTDFPLLSILTFVPLVGAVLILAFIRDDDPEVEARNARFTALWTSIAVFLVSLVLWFNFDKTTAEFQWVEKVEWMPLGVFALSEDDGSAEDSTLFLQLAISKDGIIAGTFQNTETEKSFEVEGTNDQESQRTAWGPGGESWPIMETGIYNLTENEAGALVHFADGTTQQWSLFRMDEPDKP